MLKQAEAELREAEARKITPGFLRGADLHLTGNQPDIYYSYMLSFERGPNLFLYFNKDRKYIGYGYTVDSVQFAEDRPSTTAAENHFTLSLTPLRGRNV